MMGLKIRRDDQVMVTTGRDKGKTGKIVRVNPDKETVLVEKVNVVKRHSKPSQKHKHGGIIEKEVPIHISNVMLLCAKCKGPVRVGRKFIENGAKKVRYCKSCNEVLDK
ncbi:MAG: 50S ribosomal protein L24 [Deltaproteobacteria bacterium]|nr:50S ribosomal protein L24 [Deltaproteobacteria bacterium]